MEAGQHKGVEPKNLWQSRSKYNAYSLHTFCDHIYQQEKRLLKFKHNAYYLLKKKKKTPASKETNPQLVVECSSMVFK